MQELPADAQAVSDYPYRWTGTVATPSTRVQCITVSGQGAQFSEQAKSRMWYEGSKVNGGWFKPKHAGGRPRSTPKVRVMGKTGPRHTGR